MKEYICNTNGLRSVSVNDDDISIIVMDPDEILICKGKKYQFRDKTVLIVDRLKGYGKKFSCTMIRQQMVDHNNSWGQDYIDPNKYIRDFAKKKCYPMVTVPGGIPPLVQDGNIAVPDFSMSGTSWYIVPEEDLGDVDIHYGDD